MYFLSRLVSGPETVETIVVSKVGANSFICALGIPRGVHLLGISGALLIMKGHIMVGDPALEHLIKYSIECEKEENPKLTTGAAFREFIEKFPEFLEKMNRINIDSLGLDSEGRAFLMSKLIELKLKKKKDLTYSMAFSEVQKENHGLTLLYASDIRKKR